MGPAGRALMAALAAGLAVGCSGGDGAPAANAQTPVAPADAQSRRVVDAANAFLASLDAGQRRAAQFAFDDAAQRARWSNLPAGSVPRRGVPWGDLSEPQRTALMALLGQVLTPYGVQMVRDQMDADEVLTSGGGRRNFGRDLYFIAFLGAPSTTAPWMMQFGGHHLAINATVVGPHITLSPSLTGGQPTRFERDGRTVYIVEREVAQAKAMLDGLTPAQRAKAVVSSQRIGLVLGPGHDGQVLQPEGLPASEMTAPQKAQFLKLLEARIGILNEDDAGAVMADLRGRLDQTYFAWFGPTDDAGSAYIRATGPTLIMEFSPQGRGGQEGDHLHNMYRNPTNEYGARWTSLR